MATETRDEDRLFVRDGWRHYRRRYSLAEVRWGLGVLGTLALITAWVAWRGAHPDPALFDDGTALLQAALPPATRGPLPADLAGPGWREEKLAEFDDDNLYVKINGRADYFRGFGFKRLYSVLLVSEQDPAVTIDIEAYDQGSAANALGAYGGERGPDITPQVSETGLHHLDRNALYMARGPYYLRLIGSDESEAVRGKLQALAATLAAAVPGEPLPWSYGLFVGKLGLDPGRITYFAENAFSFGFARDVWVARPRADAQDLEVFVVAAADAAAARALADRFRGGFLELGEAAGKAGTAALVKDRFVGTLSTATARDRWVLGVRGAAGKEVVAQELARVGDALAGIDPGAPAAPAAEKEADDGY